MLGPALLGCILTFPYFLDGNRAARTVVPRESNAQSEPEPFAIVTPMLLPLYEDTVQVARVLWVASGGPAQRSGIKVGDKVSVPAPREPISLPQHLFHLPSGSDLRREKLQSSPRSSRLSTLTLRLRERRAREREKLLSSSPWTRKQAISLERFKPVIDYERLCNEHCTVTESGCGMYRQLRSRLTWFKIALQFVLVAILQ